MLRLALVLLLLELEELLRVALVLLLLELDELLRVALVLLLPELRVALVLFCCELEELLRDALVLFEEDEEDELRVAVVDLELPPRVCATAGTENARAPARRAASVSLNSFIILSFLLSPGEVNRLTDVG